VKVKIYVEGGGNRRELNAKCREGFRKLFEKCGLVGRMPKPVACGSRNEAFDSFNCSPEHAQQEWYVVLLVDSEEPVADIELPLAHLIERDEWQFRAGVLDEQVLLMTTCMETWIVSDRESLRRHYGHSLQESALPPTQDLETRSRGEVQSQLEHATRICSNKYSKGKRSFELLAALDPAEMKQHLPSFVRVCRILNEKC
jgi:hypothetical protein